MRSDVEEITEDAAKAADLANNIPNLDGSISGLDSKIGTPVALDGGAATLGGMLTKMADDNGGADFDATTDSQEKIAGAISAPSSQVHVRADTIYSDGKINLLASLEVDGVVFSSATNARAALYTADGTLLDTFTTTASPDSQGEFKFPSLTRTLAQGSIYYATVVIDHSGTDRSANIKIKHQRVRYR